MRKGNFYFIKDEFFLKYKEFNLMQNKVETKRPCFYAIKTNDDLYAMIPVSSKIDKYKKIYNEKIEKNKVCDTLVFGNLLGFEKAFLIQNMFLISKKYIEKEYLDKNKIPVMLDFKLEKELTLKAKKIMGINNNLLKNNKKGVLLTDIASLKEKLLSEDKLENKISLKDKIKNAKEKIESNKKDRELVYKNLDKRLDR